MQVIKTTNTPNKLDLLRPPVSQLAKTPVFLLKVNENEALQVGRHKEKNSHVRASEHAGDFKEQNASDEFDFKALNYLNGLFSDLLHNTRVVFHNLLYVEQIQEGFLPNESDIFLGFVQTFARFRTAGFLLEPSSIIPTTDQDFYLAFKLMKKRKLSDYTDIKDKNKNKILDLIQLNFQNRTFTPQIIAQELFYNYAFIHRILALLILEKEIEFVKDFAGQKFFRLREKPVVHVVS